MLNKVTLTNFQRHRHLEVVLPGGLTALRGSNEAGKSTLLRGVCYALFGVGALSGSLEETVTWDEPINTLKAEVEFTAEGVTYTVKRGKSGAEVNYDGGIVTGQKEVTAFVCRLLKVDAAAAGRLMLSNQNEIRGALEAGTKETTQLIERLAEFDQIDNLIELMQAKLTLGNPAVAEAALARAKEVLESAKVLAAAPDVAGLSAAIARAEEQHADAAAALTEAQAAETVAQEAHAAAREKAVARDALQRSLTRASDRVEDLTRQITKLETVHAPVNAEGRTAQLNARIEQAKENISRRARYEQATSLFDADRTNGYWEGDMESLEQALEREEKNVSSLTTEATRLQGEVRLLEQQLTQGTCSFCGKDFSGVPEVAAKNADTLRKIDEATQAQSDCSRKFSSADHSLACLKAIRSASRGPLGFLAANPDIVEAVDEVLPPILQWKGEVPAPESVDVSIMRSEIAELAGLQKAFDNAQAQLEALRPQLAEALTQRSQISSELSVTPALELPQAELDAARAHTRTCAAVEKAAVEHLRDARQALKDAEAGHARALKSLEDAQEAVNARSAEIDALLFNNELLKRVRSARPIIADRLWNLVLRAVSNYFSDIRGVKSRVTKDSDGFKVDDHTVSTLSGSTLDALGLAIRVALVRTFLPSAPFLILDEPAAAMDEDRTSNMLGFIASAGFNQVILVTHEDVSESIADNMIQL